MIKQTGLQDHLFNKLGLSILLILLIPVTVWSQSNTLINTHSWEYEYIKRLQQRGHLLELNPTDLPYAFKDISRALDDINSSELNNREDRWYRMLDQRFRDRPTNVDSMRVGLLFEGGARRSSSERLNVDDPLGDGKPILPRGKLNGYLEWENWVGQAGVTFDWFYDIDPDGLDTGRRLYMRGEEAYFGYNSNRVDLYVGRFDNHWSLFDRQGAFLTDNPRSFDQIQLRFGSPKLSFSSILGEMDSMDPDSTFDGHAFELGAFRRYVFLHRLDWSPSPNLKLAFIEGELYHSQTASISMRNLLPLHFLFFESHNAPLNNNSNLLIGGSIWYQTGPVTLFLQGMLDDLIAEDREERQENRSFYPAVYTINSSVIVTDINNSFDLGLEIDLVGSNSYRSKSFQEQWTYAQRGLATNFSDYIRTKLYTTFYPNWLEGLKVEPGVTLYLKGIGDLRDLRTYTEPDGSQIPGILAGTVEKTVRPSLYFRYQPMGTQLFDPSDDIRFNYWFDADMGINFVNNYNNIEGATNTRFIGLFRLFGQITF